MIQDPFPHDVTHGAWDHALLDGCVTEIDRLVSHPSVPWQQFRNTLEWKNALRFDQVPEACVNIRAVHRTFADPLYAATLSEVTGIPGLIFDPLGGGVHAIPPGGYLAVHRDFNRDEQGRWRRVNVLVYLNHDWPTDVERSYETPGALILVDGRVPLGDPEALTVIPPTFNTTVTFVCGPTSWHGHPQPVPHDRYRYSLAAYYFTREAPADAEPPHSTIFLEDTSWQ